MSGAWRTQEGGLVDRTRTWRFSFDGRSFEGHPGDTLASALVANGVRLLGRSFKYHRPRGLLTSGSEEPNALVTLRLGARVEPNTRATVAELYDGLEARSQNGWPSLRFDALAINRLVAPLLGAGFYYKTFMWPAAFWERLYEPAIRRAAGLGRAGHAPDPDAYEKSNAFCELLVVGAGPAGLAAALTAARAGARVILADEDFRFGGRLLAEHVVLDGRTGPEWVAAAIEELASFEHVRLMSRTTVFGAYDGGAYAAVERVADHLPVPPPGVPRQRLWRIHAPQVLIAAGAIERPLLFGQNDLPGILLAGAARTYVNRYGARPGREAVVATTCDDGWRTARDLATAGVVVRAVIDSRPEARARLGDMLPAGCEALAGTVVEARGGRAVTAVRYRTSGGRVQTLDCDLLAVSGGWSPTLHLTSHRGHRPAWNEALGAFVPATLPAGMAVAGAAAGELTTADAFEAGAARAGEALDALGRARLAVRWPGVVPESAHQQAPLVPGDGPGPCFVDLQHDVTTADLALARREGYAGAELAKRYTTLGMGTDQGKTSGVNGIAVLASLQGQSIAAAGTTTFRPPYSPVAIGALAGFHRGRQFRPMRLPPAHAWAEARGAVFVEAGPWLRAQYFPRPGEADWLESVDREVRAVRGGAGVCDVSTLGKIELAGSDTLVFLERLYANDLQSLRVGRCRYGLMLREDGHVFDDGTVARLDETRFVVTTTTANAVAVFQHMQFCHQVLWPTLDVQFASVTDQWAQFSIAGPHSREVVAAVLEGGTALDDAAFPFMAAGGVRLASGSRARLFRISFSGERAYELAVPAREAIAVLEHLFAAGARFGLVPYGTEALGVMRIEKGHVAGNELNGQTTAADLSLGRLQSTKKDYVGAVLARREGLLDPTRPRLVGLKPVDRTARLWAGAHFIGIDAPNTAAQDQGFMTSVAHSPGLGHWIGLGLLRDGARRHGEILRSLDMLRGTEVRVEVCDPVFVDPSGGRLRG